MNETLKSMEENIPKQERLIDSLKANINNDKLALFDIVKKADGIWSPTFKNHSWKALANSKIELVEFERLSSLSEFDVFKEFHDYKMRKMMDFMLDNIKSTNNEKKEVWLMMLVELVNSEKNMQPEIEKIMKEGSR